MHDHPSIARIGPRSQAVSWLALVASTSLGSSHCQQLRVEVSAECWELAGASQPLRLIVQSYPAAALDRDGRPSAHARPLSSAQRSVGVEELARGVSAELVQLDEVAHDLVVVVWLEPGEADLDYDALRARPESAVLYGEAAQDGDGRRRVHLRPPAARAVA